MGSLVLSAEDRKVLLADLQSVYDEHRYLDAYRLSAQYWSPSTDLKDLSAEELIFAGRLASRLGGFRVSRHLYRAARERHPDLPIVRYFTRNITGSRHLLLDELLEFEKKPDLGGGHDHLRASWLASYAYTYGTLRDFCRAAELMEQAHALSPGDAWLYSLESDVLGMADRWTEARDIAERGCQADPRSPWPVLSLATSLLNLGEIREAVAVSSRAAEKSQFFQIVLTACWYHCALAETLQGTERSEALEAARELAERLEPVTPLADREFKVFVARTWLDICELADDHTAMEFWSGEARSPFHRKVLANLQANPGDKRIRLPYQRTIQKHVECVPTSIASALSATGVSVSVEEIAREVTFGGTAEWAAADWLRGKGFHVRFFSATSDVAARLIEAGIGFTVSWEDDQSGHAVAIVGIDHAAGTVIAHDPSSFRSTEYLLTNFTEKYGPLGVQAMAAVPLTLANVLDEALPPEAEVVEAAQAHQRALALYGPSAARPIISDLEAEFPEHPGTQYLRAIQYQEDGRSGKALASFRSLLEAFPKSPMVRFRLMSACQSLGDTALLRETLRSVIDSGKVPGVNSQTGWTTPHHRYFSEYADLLRFSAQTRARAESLLRTGLKTYAHSAGAWHVLADLRWDQRNFETALLGYRIASTLAEHNEHYARAYADALCRSNRQEDAMAWLRDRAEKLGTSVHGVSTWITYVDALEDWGEPTRALEVCRSVLGLFGTSPSLLSYAVPFLARMGEWEEAERELRELQGTEGRGYFHEAAVFFNDMRGRTTQALEHAQAWVREFPSSNPARNKLLALTAKVHGQNTAFEIALQWMHQRPENEQIEDLFCEYADDHRWRKLRVLKARVKRNPEDAWAWRELAFSVIPIFEMTDEAHRRRLAPRISKYIAEAGRVAGHEAATFRARGYWHEAQANWKEASGNYIESIRRDPASSFGYRRAFEVSYWSSDADRRSMWAAMEPLWLGNAGHLPNGLELMRLLNGAFGPRETEQIITGWQTLRPDDPNVTEAMADLLLEHGHGRSDALRALILLRPAVDRYPYHSGLRFSLARAYRGTGDDAAARETFRELVRRRPDNVSALIQLAWIQDREGNTDEALRTLQTAEEQEPQNPDPIDSRARVLIENQRYEEACAVIADGLRKLPRSVHMYQRAISLFSSCGDDEKAVEAARQGVRAYPEGGYLWLLLGRTLREHAEFAAPGEIEECLRRSLRRNQGLFESADWLAIMLTEQRRYEDAERVVSAVEARLTDPSAVRGRKAWIKREAGAKKEAVSDLAQAMNDFPGYAWGWNVLLAWFEEDKDWEQAKKLLGPLPPQMLSDVSFRLKRLQMLEKTKTDTAALDTEWEQLLDDFPENVPLYLNRYDSLQETRRSAEAATVLARIAPFADDDAYFLARFVDVKCREGKFGEALECASRVCFAPVEQSTWPVNHVWDSLSRVNEEQKLAEAFRVRVEQGDRPTQRALSRFVEWTVDQERPGGFIRVLRQTRLHHVAREIRSLMNAIERSSWRSDLSVADVFATLNKVRYPRLVVEFWNSMCDPGLLGDSDEWAQAGRAMVTLGQRARARELFRDWRSRRGVHMWSLANYLQCLPRFSREGLEEVIDTCRDALAQLPHDHCARYLAIMQAESSALMGDKAGLLGVWQERRAYFGGELKPGEYFRTEYKYLLYDIPDLVEALQQDDRKAYRKLLWRLRLKRFWSQQTRVAVRKVVAWVLRFIMFGWLIGNIAGIFTR